MGKIDIDFEINVKIQFPNLGNKKKAREQFIAYRDALHTILNMTGCHEAVITTKEV
jgi:hypothetical protein